jgi:hypothetical protein
MNVSIAVLNATISEMFNFPLRIDATYMDCVMSPMQSSGYPQGAPSRRRSGENNLRL